MKKEKWYKNIPTQGILIIHIESGCRYVVNNYHEESITVMTDDGLCLDPNECIVINAQQWWDLAPWNYDMSIAESQCNVIIKTKEECLCAWFINGKWIEFSDNTDGYDIIKNPIAWLPLPITKIKN